MGVRICREESILIWALHGDGCDFDSPAALAMEKGSLIPNGQKDVLAQSRCIRSGTVKSPLALAENRTPVFNLQAPNFISMLTGYA
jgi:hypothetical protein